MNIGSKLSTNLEGRSLIGKGLGEQSDRFFRAFDPRTGIEIEPDFHTASADEVERAALLSEEAAVSYGRIENQKKAAFLISIAENLESIRGEIVARASLETGLPEARFEGELGRTCGQLRMFAAVVTEGSWVDARIDRAQPERSPLPKPDVRSMLRPVGPVAVFCASNFPLAFSVAGGDTASALAAGCPVIVVAHTAHPGTAELAGKAIRQAILENKLAEGVFSLIFSKGYEIGQKLVKHPKIKAVAFTGSRKGGRALMDLAGSRKEPIPVFAEMSSVNPVFVLPGALETRGEEITEGLFASFTLGYGQFCTKPGIVVLPKSDSARSLVERLTALAAAAAPVPLLTKGIQDSYLDKMNERGVVNKVGVEGFSVDAMVKTVGSREFLDNPTLSDEAFGPSTLLVLAEDENEFRKIAKQIEGQLTATIHAAEDELLSNADLVALLENKAGRLVVNAFPTGVEVCGAMVHGGPYPATSDSRSTSVGKRSIERFTRLVAFQGFPDASLPDELKDGNPLTISRLEE